MKKAFQDPIDLRERKQGSISSLLDNYIDRFVVNESPRLDLQDKHGNDILSKEDIEILKSGRCYYCGCKLYTDLKGNVMCKSAKHKKITKKRLYITSKGFEKFK